MSISNYSNIEPVCIIIGQSNADGRARHSYLSGPLATWGLTQEDVNIYYKPMSRSGPVVPVQWYADDGELYTLYTGHDGANKKTCQNITLLTVDNSSETYHGAEISLGYNYSISRPDSSMTIIKTGISGSAIETNWKITGDDDDGLWSLFHNYVLIPALNDIYALGKIPAIVGIWWMQGESDADLNADALAYETRLQLLVDRIKYSIGSDLPIIIGGLSNYRSDADWLTVKQAQINVANANSNCTLLPTDGSGSSGAWAVTAGDEIHYSTAGLIQGGSELNTLVQINYDNYTPVDTHLSFDENSKFVHPSIVITDFDVSVDFDISGSKPWSIPISRGDIGAFIGYDSVNQLIRCRSQTGGTHDIPTLSPLDGRYILRVTYDGSLLSVYIDGVLQGTKSIAVESFRFNQVGYGIPEFKYTGRMFSYNLKQYNGTKIIEYDFSSDAGQTTIIDTSGNANNGTITGALWYGGIPAGIGRAKTLSSNYASGFSAGFFR